MDEETGLLTNVQNTFWTRRTPNQRTAIVLGSVLVIAAIIIGISIGVAKSSGSDDSGTTTVPPTEAPTTLPPTVQPTVTPTAGPTGAPTTSPPTEQPTQPPTTLPPTAPPTEPPTTLPPTTQPPTDPPTAPTTQPPTAPPTTVTPTVAPTTAPPTEPPTTLPPTEPPTTQPATPPPTAPPTEPPTTQPATETPTTQPPTAPPTAPPTSTTEQPPMAVCETPMCIAESERILSNMNPNVDPCEDFYEYTCGNYSSTHILPDDKGRYGNFDEAGDILNKRLAEIYQDNIPENEPKPLKFVRRVYKKCADKDKLSLEPIRKQLTQLGGWPIGGIPTNGIDVRRLMINLIGVQETSLVSVSVQPNPYNTKSYSVNLDQLTLGVGRTDLLSYKKDPEAGKLIEAYKTFMADAIKLFRTDINVEELKKQVDQLVDFEVKLAEATTAPEDRRDHFANTHEMTFEELSRSTEGYNWFDFVVELYKFINPEEKIDGNMKVIVSDLSYLLKLSKMLNEMTNKKDEDIIRNYLGWRYVQSNAYLASNELREIEFNFKKVQTGVEKETPMNERCISLLSNIVPMLVGRHYVFKYFPEESKQSAEEIIYHLIDSYNQSITTIDWIDSETKSKSLLKIKSLKINTGYPEWIYDDFYLERTFDFGIDLDENTPMFEMLTRIAQVLSRNMFKKIRNQVDPDKEWPMGPAIVNAAYDPSQNSITIPAGILQGVLFNESRPLYLNYGAIGAVVGHEIGHGFDDEGSQFDHEGNLKNWWSNETRNNFNSKADCFVKQYSAITDDKVNMTLNGKNTLGENIADNGGVRESLDAYSHLGKNEGRLPGALLKMTQEQLFFISYANNWCSITRDASLRNQILYDPHSPPKYRVNVPVLNFDTFGKSFNCPKGSKMRPSDQCVLW